jgi:hypothetical protein
MQDLRSGNEVVLHLEDRGPWSSIQEFYGFNVEHLQQRYELFDVLGNLSVSIDSFERFVNNGHVCLPLAADVSIPQFAAWIHYVGLAGAPYGAAIQLKFLASSFREEVDWKAASRAAMGPWFLMEYYSGSSTLMLDAIARAIGIMNGAKGLLRMLCGLYREIATTIYETQGARSFGPVDCRDSDPIWPNSDRTRFDAALLCMECKTMLHVLKDFYFCGRCI